jgi:hypothetical protein
VNQVVALNRKIGMPREPHAQKQIAALPPTLTRLPLARQPDALSLANAARNFHLICFHFVRSGPAQRNRSGRTMKGFFQGHHDIGFDVAAAFSSGLASAKATKG